MTEPVRRFPDFIGIGAQKCGTTALHAYLRGHPDAFLPSVKELQFFRDSGNWSKGLDWYCEQFRGAGREAVLGEISPQYARLPSSIEVVPRMRSIVPDARIVYLVRDPLERMVSAWLEARGRGRESRPLEASLLEDPRYVDHSRYFYQLEPFLEEFGRHQILVVDSRRLRVERRDGLASIMAFVGLDPGRYDWERERNRVHVSTDKSRPHQTAIRLAQSELGTRLKGLIPRWLKRRIMHVGAASLGSEDTMISRSTLDRLKEEVRADALRLRAFMPPEWDAWGLAD